MSIHILTQNPEVKKRLSTFFEDMGKDYVFHETLLTLEKKLSRLKKTDAVFYDLQLEEHIWAFEPIYLGSRKTHMVVFEPNDTGSVNYTPMGTEHFLILSKDEARAKTRLIALFRELNKLSAPRKSATKKAKKKISAKKSRTTPQSKATDATSTTAQLPLETSAAQPTTRYLQACSDAMRHFTSELKTAAGGKHQFTMLQGEDGAEFELVARELNFQANSDTSPLIVLDPMHLKCHELDQLADAAKDANVDQYCYLGLTLELNSQSVSEIATFLGHLKIQDKDSRLHMIVGHEIDSESCFPDNIRPTLDALRSNSHLLQIPSMADRAADISAIAHATFSTLRMAHPFLQARSISSEAIQHLQSECSVLDYSRITRVLRNAMALGQSPIVTEQELKNFSDNSPTTQHLIESLADEKYFSSQ